MSDIVERLREILTISLPADNVSLEAVARIRRMMVERSEAVAEIERLRAALREADRLLRHSYITDAIEIIAAALAGKGETPRHEDTLESAMAWFDDTLKDISGKGET